MGVESRYGCHSRVSRARRRRTGAFIVSNGPTRSSTLAQETLRGTATTPPTSSRAATVGEVAELPKEQYDQGRRDGEGVSVTIDPWLPPASEWSHVEREAYAAGFRAGRATRAQGVERRPSRPCS